MKTTLVFCSLFLLLALVTSVQIRNRKFYDDQGRQMKFRGPNVVVKVPPYMPRLYEYDPVWSFSQQDMKQCQKLGLNAIRLGMMWAGVEPNEKGYNETYLDEMEKLINKAGQYGIYTVIDFHQDLIAQKFCGDGVPTWLMTKLNLYKTFPYPIGKKIPLNQSGLPSWKDCNTSGWGMYYFSYDVGETFNKLYHPNHELNKKFTNFWVKVASKFRNNKNVLAYELINEPFPGNVIRNPVILVPSMGERVNFQSFYDRLSAQIRKVDEKTPICFEPVTFDNSVPTGFSHPPGGNRFKDNSIFCYHYYKPPATNLSTIDYRVKDAEKLGVSSILTQFHQGEGQGVESVLSRAYQLKQSWLFWGYKSFGKGWGSSSDLSDEKVGGIASIMSPTYLQLTAGDIKEEKFNFKTKLYEVSYNANPEGTSVLFLNREWNYMNGFELELHPKQLLSWQQKEEGYFEIKYSGDKIRLVQIIVNPY